MELCTQHRPSIVVLGGSAALCLPLFRAGVESALAGFSSAPVPALRQTALGDFGGALGLRCSGAEALICYCWGRLRGEGAAGGTLRACFSVSAKVSRVPKPAPEGRIRGVLRNKSR